MSENQYLCESRDFKVGSTFLELDDVKLAVKSFAKFTVRQSSSRDKYFCFTCTRAGIAPTSVMPEDRIRNKTSKRLGCPFRVKVVKKNNKFTITEICNTHNHAELTEEEASLMPQNRFIPDDVKEKMKDLHALGCLKGATINKLIQEDYFPNIKVTWTMKDVYNYFGGLKTANAEASSFLKLLEEKRNTDPRWILKYDLNNVTMRLEHCFWMSPSGRDSYSRFHDVVEVDATYKTNRFNMPLVLATGIDNHGLTTLLCGALLKDEKASSYLWFMEALKAACQNVNPTVIFTDGDTELAAAIEKFFPSSVHLLCRYHISQNVTKNLSKRLGKQFQRFLGDFWNVSSLENIGEFDMAWAKLKKENPFAVSYLEKQLEPLKRKWAFAYTHRFFTAGVASTQRQESMNFQVKHNLIYKSTLSMLVKSFEKVEKKVAEKVLQASLEGKLMPASPDPVIDGALQRLSPYAGNLLRAECHLATAYICYEDGAGFKVSHKDNPEKSQTVIPNRNGVLVCSCRKATWQGTRVPPCDNSPQATKHSRHTNFMVQRKVVQRIC
eukprot:UC4_evm7s1127